MCGSALLQLCAARTKATTAADHRTELPSCLVAWCAPRCTATGAAVLNRLRRSRQSTILVKRPTILLILLWSPPPAPNPRTYAPRCSAA